MSGPSPPGGTGAGVVVAPSSAAFRAPAVPSASPSQPQRAASGQHPLHAHPPPPAASNNAAPHAAAAGVHSSPASPASPSGVVAPSSTLAAAAQFRTQLNQLLNMAAPDSQMSDQLTALKLLCELINTSGRGPPAIAERQLEMVAIDFMPTFHRFLTTAPGGGPSVAQQPGKDPSADYAAQQRLRHPSSLILHIVQSLALLSRPISASPSTLAASARILRIIVDEYGLLPILLEMLLATNEKRLIEALLALLTHLAKHKSPEGSRPPAEYIAERALDKLMPYCILHSSDAIKGNTLALIAALLEHYLAPNPTEPASTAAAVPPSDGGASALASRMFLPASSDALKKHSPPSKVQQYAFMEDLLAKRNLLYFLSEMREGKNVEAGPVGSDLTGKHSSAASSSSSSSSSSLAASSNSRSLSGSSAILAGGSVDLANFNPATCVIPLSLILPPPTYEVSQNIARCQHLLGFTPGKDEPHYRAMVDSLQSMGFMRGAVEWCIWRWQREHPRAPSQQQQQQKRPSLNSGPGGSALPAAAEVNSAAAAHQANLPDLQIIMTHLLDHTQPPESAVLPSPSPLHAKNGAVHGAIGGPQRHARNGPPQAAGGGGGGRNGVGASSAAPSGVPLKREPSEALAPLLGKPLAVSPSPSSSPVVPLRPLADALAPLLSKKHVKKLPKPTPSPPAAAVAAATAAAAAAASVQLAHIEDYASRGPSIGASSASASSSSLTHAIHPPMLRSVTTPLPSAPLPSPKAGEIRFSIRPSQAGPSPAGGPPALRPRLGSDPTSAEEDLSDSSAGSSEMGSSGEEQEGAAMPQMAAGVPRAASAHGDAAHGHHRRPLSTLSPEELAQLYATQSDSIALLKDMGFHERAILLALSSHGSVEASVRWLVEQQELKEKRTEQRAQQRARKEERRRSGLSSAASTPMASPAASPMSMPVGASAPSSSSVAASAQPHHSPQRPSITISPASGGGSSSSHAPQSMPLPPHSAPSQLDPPSLLLPPALPTPALAAASGSHSLALPMSAPAPSTPDPHSSSSSAIGIGSGGMKNSKSFDPLLPARLDLGPLSPASSPFSPASASAAVSPMMIDQSLGAHPSEQDGDSDADPGSMRHERGGKRDAGGAMLAVSSSQRPSAISSRSTSAGEGEPVSSVSSGSREDSLARLGPSRQSSSSQVGASASSVNSPAPFGQSRLSLPSSSSGVALHQLSPGAANTEAPPLLLSPQLLDHYSPAPRERATTTPAAFPGHVLTPMSQLAPTLGGPFPPVSPNPSVGSPYEGGGAAGPMGSRRNYYDESPDPSPSAGMSVSQAGVHTPSTSSMYPANRSTPHSRSHSPRHPSFASTSSLYSSSSSGGGSGGVMMSPTQIERQSSFGHPSPFERQSSRGERERQETPQEAAARLREEQYWEEQNSATYPARRPFLPPNRKPSPAVMQRPAYFNPHASPSPPPNQTGGVGRMHSFSNPPYYQPQQGAGQHHHTHSQQVQAHSSSHHGGGLNKQNTWSPGQLRQSPSDYKQQQQTQSGSHASPVPGSASSFHPDRMYGEGESGAGSMSASPAPGPRYPSGGGFPPSLYHAATLPSSSSGSARMHYHSVSQHTSPHHPGRHSYSSSGVIGGGAGHSHSTSPSSMNHGGAGASGPGGPMMSISSSGEGEGSGSHHVSLTDLNDPRSSTTSPHSVHSSSDSTEDSDSSHIISWLRSSHFTEYIPLFLHHEVSLEMIRGGEIEESDLQNMGIEALGVRKKMMRAIRGEQQQQQQKGAQMQQQAHAYPYGASSSNYHNDREGSHQSDRQTPQHFYSSPPISTSNNALSTHTDPESTSGTPRATSPMNTDGTREQHRESRHSLPSNSPVHYSSTSDSHRLSLTSTNNGSGSGQLYLGPPPISHHPHSDLGEYHRGGERERMQSGRYSVTANETGGGGGGGGYIYGNDRNNASLSVPQTTMDLMHSRSQSHDSLHPALLLSPGQYQPPSNNNDGGNRGGLSSSQQYQPNNDRHPTNDRHQQQSVSQLALHISFLQASPLLHSESPGRSHALNIEKETELIRDSLIESGRQFRVRFSIATKQNLLKMLTKGTRALHISGHGDPHHLILENGLGGVEALDQTVLRDLLVVGGSDLQFVFISSCFSYRAAVAFLAAGVKHVIAVQEDTQVSDTSARAFAAHVYLALCQGRSVREAFHKGQAAVLASNSKNKNEACCCAHLHAGHCHVCETCRSPMCCAVHTAPCHTVTSCCSPTIPHGESLKFLLLPKEDGTSSVNHDVRLFDDVSEGRWMDLTPAKPPNNLPSNADHFTGRSQDVFAVIQIVLSSRLTTVTGQQGVGKSALARACGTYINDRRHFEHGVFLIKCGKITDRQKRERSMHAVEGISSASAATPPIAVAHELNLAISRALNLDFSGGQPAHGVQHGQHHHGHHHGHHNSHLDPDTLQEQLLGWLRDKHLCLILDDIDDLLVNQVNRPDTKQYIKTLLDSTFQTHLLLTANLQPTSGPNSSSSSGASSSSSTSAASSGAAVGVHIPGHTSKLYHLGPLHLLDSVVLLIHRFPRDLRPEEYGRMRNVQDFTDGQPIIQRLRGNPRLLEWSAELLNHLSLEQLTQLLCQPVLNLHQPMNSPAQHSSPPSSHGGMLSSSSPPLLQSGAASHRMEWIQTQPAWMQLSSEAQTLVRKLVHLLESVPSAPSSSSSSNGADASGRSNSVVSPHPGAGSPGSDRSSPPSAMVSSGSAASTYSSSQPGASMAGASPGNATVLSPTSAPVEGSHSHPNPLAYLQRTQSEPQREASPAPEHRSSEQIPTFPVPSSAESSRASEPQPPQLQPSPDSSDPARPRSPASSPTIHVSSAMSSGEDDSDSDGYDRHAAVLSPICAPHGDHLHSQARKLARHSSSADSLKLASLAKALEEEEDAQEAKQTSP